MGATFTLECLDCGAGVPVTAVQDAATFICGSCGRSYDCHGNLLLLGQPEAPDDYPDHLHALLAAAEPRHFWFGERNRLILSVMRESLGPLAGLRVLDVGCGTGFVTAALARAGMVTCGVDMNDAGLRFARDRTAGLFVRQNAAQIPFRSEFDVAMLCDVVEHVADPEPVLRATRRSLKASGAVVVTVPAHPALWTPLDEVAGHKRRYTRRSLTASLTRAGFSVEIVRYFNVALLPAQVLQRRILLRRAVRSAEDRERLVRDALRVPPRPLNAVLRLAMAADLLLSRIPGLTGASLIAIGRAA